MAASKIFTRVSLTLMLYLASTRSLAQSERNLQMNSSTINMTYGGGPDPSTDPRDPSFISNVLHGLDIASRIAGYQVPLIEIVTGVPSRRQSSSVGDFTSMQLFVLIMPSEIACISSMQPWGTWEGRLSYKRRAIPGLDVAIPIWKLREYDQWLAFRALPASFGPWSIIYLREGIVAPQTILTWYFRNDERDRCVLVFRNPNLTWNVHAAPISICGWYGLPANMSVPRTFLLDDANTNFSSSTSNLPPSTAGTNATQVALNMQKLDGFNETDGDYQLVATS